MVIRKDDDEGNGFPGEDQLIRRLRSPEANPLIVRVGLPVQKI